MKLINPVDSAPGRSDITRGGAAPCEHVVHIYHEEGDFLDSMAGFVGGGLEAGDGTIVISTADHLAALNERLLYRGVSLHIARARDQYIALDAEETMARFMVNGWPDEMLFEQCVTPLLLRARAGDRRVRAFAEIIAVMGCRGLNGAAVRLEDLWHHLCQRESFSLFCACPRSGIATDADAPIKEICATYSRVLAATSDT